LKGDSLMEIIAEQLINLPWIELVKVEGVNPLHIYARSKKERVCIHCQSKRLHIKDFKERQIRHENISFREVFLKIEARKFKCLECGKFFWERFDGILPHNNKTEAFRKQIAHQAFRGVTKKDIAKDYDIGEATAYRYFLEELLIKSKQRSGYQCPKVLGIDEHFFTKKKGYATTFCDLSRNKVFDVVLGRSEKALEVYLRKLEHRDKVKVVVIDLSQTYRSIVEKYFPNAKIVSDRFHVIRLINIHFLKFWKDLDPVGSKNRGLLSLIRRHEKNLTKEQKQKIEKYFKQYPELKAVYLFKQKLCRLLLIKHRTAKQCKNLIPVFLKYIKQLKESMLDSMVTLGNTLDSWSEEVVRMWRFSKSNGITEGFHNKMKMLVRRAYGLLSLSFDAIPKFVPY